MKPKAPIKRRSGHPPDVLRKSGPMRDRTKYRRKPKHKGANDGQ